MDWIMGLAGGALIGLGGAVFLLMNGRIMGASGLPWVLALLFGAVDNHLTSNVALLIAGGLLVGVGTRIANGCTSGHGVCGISRLSLRGIVATCFYILAGGLTIAVFRHILGVM